MTTKNEMAQTPFLLQFGERIDGSNLSKNNEQDKCRRDESSSYELCGVTKKTAVASETTDDD